MSRPIVLAFVLAAALGMSACVVNAPATRPQAVASQPDTFRFRIFPSALVMEGVFADRAADEEIGKFRSANGYASSAILSRDYQDRAFLYTVKFSR